MAKNPEQQKTKYVTKVKVIHRGTVRRNKESNKAWYKAAYSGKNTRWMSHGRVPDKVLKQQRGR